MSQAEIAPIASSNAVVEKLKTLLANNYTLYLKTQNYHWNVTGPQFRSLHLLFEEQYNDLFTANDEIAERIRTLGSPAPGSYSAFSKLSSIKEAGEEVIPAETMVKQLAEDQKTILDSLMDVLEAAQEAGDEGTVDLVTGRISVHEKAAWMLRSSI